MIMDSKKNIMQPKKKLEMDSKYLGFKDGWKTKSDILIPRSMKCIYSNFHLFLGSHT